MLKWFDNNNYIDDIPRKYKKDYTNSISRMSKNELDIIETFLNELIDKCIVDNSNILTSSWVPGKEWEGTVFMPIYTKAAQKNVEYAGMIFGLILYEVIIKRSELWYCGKFEKDGIPIGGTTYFRSND